MIRFRMTTRTAVSVTIAIVLTLESIFFAIVYLRAAKQIRGNDPRKSANLVGTIVFARPKLYTRGQALNLDEIRNHLLEIGFQERAGNEPGTFHVMGNALQINSRLQGFPNAIISFDRGKISAINVAGNAVSQVEVEPQTLISFMRMMRDERARVMNVRRIVLPPSAFIPSQLYDAVRASEDKNFETHNGVDETGMLRSFIYSAKNLFTRSAGGSTITQQMVKNIVLKNQDRSFNRKWNEFFIALASERMLEKEDIFAAYANNCYIGHVQNGPTILGFEAASQEFFGAGVEKISLSNAACLAALLDGPERYTSAARNNEYSALIRRRNRVLDLMRENYGDRYSEEAIAKAKADLLKFVFTSSQEEERSLDIISKPFQNLAANELADVIGKDYESGNTLIFTTIDPELQVAAYKAVVEHLVKLDPAVARVRRRLPPEQRGDDPIQAALVAMDAQTGEILAMMGGRESEFNYATAERSPGSALKPLVYLQAIIQGNHQGEPFTAATIIDPQNDLVDDYRPDNHVGSPATARALLARSDNGGAVVAGYDAGLASVRELISKLTGAYSSELTGMLVIGGSAGSEVSALRMCEGYSIFPNNGIKVSHTLLAAVYQDGLKVPLPHAAPERITDAAPAFVVTQMMRSVLKAGGTANGALEMAGLTGNFNVSGKTGTGQVADFYFVAFSKRLVVAVWVGMPKNKPALQMKDGFTGASAAMPIWASFIKNGVKRHRPDLLEGEFDAPANVRIHNIDRKRGCITSRPGVSEYFIQGREPKPCPK